MALGSSTRLAVNFRGLACRLIFRTGRRRLLIEMPRIATGTLIFTPGLAALVEWGGWKPVVLTVAACCAALA
jgi:hypothetical protein